MHTFRLAECYRAGEGVHKDVAQAAAWYGKAAEAGHAEACFRLAECYTRVAVQGNADAQNNLGSCYQKGKGVDRDYPKAVEWYTKAAEQGNEDAKKALENMDNIILNHLPPACNSTMSEDSSESLAIARR